MLAIIHVTQLVVFAARANAAETLVAGEPRSDFVSAGQSFI